MKKVCALKTTPFFWYAKSWFSVLIACLLWPVACLYRLIIASRRTCYRWRLCETHNFPVPVIVVGNITVGGTGKTPLVMWLVNFLREQGMRPGIVSRGYGRISRGVLDVTDASSVAEVGDEALMMVRRTHCPMVVGENRVAAVQKLLAEHKCDVIISDDGLQHYALGRAMEIVVLDGERGVGNGFCLPAGPLRESVARLQRVNFVVNDLQFIPECFCNVADEKQAMSLQEFITYAADKKCCVVAGIGNPVRFFRQVRELGLKATEHVFPDHHRYVAADFAAIADELILMTEKDAVKCQTFAHKNWWYLRVNVQPGDDFSARLLRDLKVAMKKSA